VLKSFARGDLRGLFSKAACSFQILTNLLAAGTGCVEILLRAALDLRRATASSSDFIANLAKPIGQLGLVDGSGKLLRSEEALRLDRAVLAVLALGDVEDNGMGMELRRNVAIDRPGLCRARTLRR
jgi:hypothetical protein